MRPAHLCEFSGWRGQGGQQDGGGQGQRVFVGNERELWFVGPFSSTCKELRWIISQSTSSTDTKDSVLLTSFLRDVISHDHSLFRAALFSPGQDQGSRGPTKSQGQSLQKAIALAQHFPCRTLMILTGAPQSQRQAGLGCSGSVGGADLCARRVPIGRFSCTF